MHSSRFSVLVVLLAILLVTSGSVTGTSNQTELNNLSQSVPMAVPDPSSDLIQPLR
jgi:hypothetical protein